MSGHGSRIESNGALKPASDYPLRAEAAGRIVRRAILADPPRNARPDYMRQKSLLVVLATLALEAGKAVAAIKPMAITLAEADALVATSTAVEARSNLSASLAFAESARSGQTVRPAAAP